jgi:hypothetical protein
MIENVRRASRALGRPCDKDLAPPEMTSALRGMPPQEKEALADYITRLGGSEPMPDSSRPKTCRSNAPSTYTLAPFHVATSCLSRYAAIRAAREPD